MVDATLVDMMTRGTGAGLGVGHPCDRRCRQHLRPRRADNLAFADRLVLRLASLPGVTAVGYSNNLPLIQQGFARDVSARPMAPGERAPRPYPSSASGH